MYKRGERYNVRIAEMLESGHAELLRVTVHCTCRDCGYGWAIQLNKLTDLEFIGPQRLRCKCQRLPEGKRLALRDSRQRLVSVQRSNQVRHD